MNLITQLALWNIASVVVLIFLVLVLAREIGFRIGRRTAARGSAAPEGVGIVVGALLGLLAFVLALTLSFANTRFSERRAGALAEANAIGTAWLRAEALGHPRGFAIAHALQDYAKIRAAFVQATIDPAELDRMNNRTQALQTEMWGHAAALVRERPDAIIAALTASLNETFDMSTSERFAYDFTLPAPLFWLLILMAVISIMAVGVQLGLRGNPVRVLSTLLTLVWSLVMVAILDLSAARLGEFRISTHVYDWTIQGIGKDIVIPPLPAPN